MTKLDKTAEHDNKDALIKELMLDTHILIWYLQGTHLSEAQIQLIDQARNNNSLFISAITIWEISLLLQKEKITFSMSLNEVTAKITTIPGLQILDLTIDILVESTILPNYEYRDPADRMIIASCRHHDSYLMTRDQKIIDYAQKGYLKIAHEVNS